MIGDLPEGVPTPMVGDEVLIRATVVKWQPGVGARVELFSKTDQYQAWIRADHIAEVVVNDIPVAEPADGTILAGEEPGGVNLRVFVRDDAEGHNDPDRRHDRHWWDVTAEDWVDWPTAVRRGANPDRVLREVRP